MRIGIMAIVALLISTMAASAQTDLCRDPAGVCGRLVTADCLGRVGAGSLATAALDGACGEQLSKYRDCVATAAEQCGGSSATSADRCDTASADTLWTLAEADDDCLSYRAFLDACPNALRAGFARARLQRLGCAAPTPAPPPAWTASVNDYRAAQSELERLGFYKGGVDGVWGRGSAEALRQFRLSQGNAVADGALTETSLETLRAAPTPAPAAAPAAGETVLAPTDDTLYFAADSADLTPAAKAFLDGWAARLRAEPTMDIFIQGHADDSGGREHNLALASRRVGAVRDYLVTKKGVDSGRVYGSGYGSERPLKECSDEPCRRENRRAVLEPR